MARIVIVAKPSELFEFVAYTLTEAGHRVRFLDSCRSLVSKISRLLPDIVVVDAVDSLAVAEEISMRIRRRYTRDRSRILILRAKAEAESRGSSVFGPEAYMERPLHPRSFLSRVEAILADTVVEQAQQTIAVGNLVIDPSSYQVTRSGKHLSLTLLEFRLLHYMASRPNLLCRRDQLLALGWENPNVTPRTIDVFVRHLRTKIEADPRKPQFICSVRTQGYCFHIPDELSNLTIVRNAISSEANTVINMPYSDAETFSPNQHEESEHGEVTWRESISSRVEKAFAQ